MSSAGGAVEQPSRIVAASATTADAVAALLRNIAPLPTGPNRFVIELSDDVVHVFGGMLAAQALHCAQQTVTPDRHVSSIHAYFVRRAEPRLPLEFDVRVNSDGRSVSSRSISVSQQGKPIFEMMCAFKVPTAEWNFAATERHDAPDPQELLNARTERFGDAFDVLEHLPRPVNPDEQHSPDRLWVRVADKLPDDPRLHECLLLYVSDMGTPWHFATPPDIRVGVSLDHAVWFHAPSRMDAWHYIALEPVSSADARGIYMGRIWDSSHTQVATVAQENLLRQA